MIKNEIKFDFNDISLIPTIISDIRTRKDINVFDINKKLPLIVSPMDTVIDENNYKIFMNLGFIVCIPRNFNKKIKFEDECFISFGLDEIENIVNNDNNQILPKRVLIDVANGHSIRVFEISKKIKENYNIELMIGNIANPYTYKQYCGIGVDYIRIGIGAGHACLIDDTKIKTLNDYKNIQDLNIGDIVLTHTGEYKEIILKHSFKCKDDYFIKINNKITSTKDHKFCVINKKFKDIITDDNIQEYMEWIEAEKLEANYMLLEIDTNV